MKLLLLIFPSVLSAQYVMVGGPVSSRSAPPPPTYTYSRQLTVDRTKCGTSNLTNFPVLVSISDTTMKIAGSGGRIQNSTTQASGPVVTMPADLIFTSDSLGATKIPWEVESWNSGTGTLVAWVMLATVNGSAAGGNTTFYVFYDAVAVTTPQNTGSWTPANVWDANHVIVAHLGSSLLADSTSNANTLTNVASATSGTGQIDGAGVFNGTSQYLTRADNAGLRPTSVTVSAWAKASSGPGNFVKIVMKPSQTAADDGYDLGTNSSGHWRGYVWNNGGATLVAASDSSAITVGSWYFLTMTYDSATATTKLYVNNNAAITTTAGSGNISYGTSTASLTVGASLDYLGFLVASSEFPGSIDEVRVSNIARPADWIATSYNNGNAPGNIGADNFIIFGGEVTN